VTKTPKKVVSYVSETPKGKSDTHMIETRKTRTKTAGVKPKKGWSKVNVTAGRSKKMKVVSSSYSEFNVEEDVQDIIPSTSKKSAGKKISQNVANVPIDKVSFHLPENAQRWIFIFRRRMALERELGKDTLECEVVMELIKEEGLLKTICKLCSCYERLVKEFLVNIPEDCVNPQIQEYQKVFVRGEFVNFSPNIIN